MKRLEPEVADAVLDALTAHIAVLREDGVIIAVNDAWRRFALDNGGDPGRMTVGANYLTVCETAARSGTDATAADMLLGLRRVAAGVADEFSIEYPCHSPDEERWFVARATRSAHDRVLRVVVSHENITRRHQAEAALRATEQRLRIANEELSEAKQALEKANDELQQALVRERLAARTDELTGAYNRRHFFEIATALYDAARRYGRPLSVILLDVDHFKRVNDRFGHEAGDQVLITVVAILRKQLRAADLFARFGGEEFIVLLPDSNAREAEQLAVRICESLRARRIDTGRGVIGVTISAGVTALQQDQSLPELIARADQALYAAKDSGRDRVVVIADN